MTGITVVLDTARLLDESPAGKASAARLQASYDDKRARYEALRDKGTTAAGHKKALEAAAAFQSEAITGLEDERARLRTEVLSVCRDAITAVMAEKKAAVVVDARVCLVVDPAADITDAVLARLR